MYADIKLIDITLREGGHKTNFHFNDKVIKTVLHFLDQSFIDYVEVGYRDGLYDKIQDIGLVDLCPKSYLNYCRKNLCNSNLTVMIHPKNVYSNDFEEISKAGVDAINICFDYQYPFLTFKIIEQLHAYNFELFITLPKISKLTTEKINDYIGSLIRSGITNICLADTNGSLLPTKVSEIYKSLNSTYYIFTGFHGYDHLSLAHSNAIAAIENKAKFISSSLYGFGKYNGNLRTEAIASFLHLNGVSKYILYELYEAAQYIKDHVYPYKDEVIIQNMINASFDLSPEDKVDSKLLQVVKDYSKADISLKSNHPNYKK